MPTYKGYLKDLIFAAGGHIVEEITEMPRSAGMVIYSLDPPQEGNSADTKGVIDVRLQEAKATAAAIGAEVIAHTWVLDSIAACKVQPLSHWILPRFDLDVVYHEPVPEENGSRGSLFYYDAYIW